MSATAFSTLFNDEIIYHSNKRLTFATYNLQPRSEERRVGKEC